MKLIYLEWCDAMSTRQSWMDVEEAKEWAKGNEWLVRETGFLIEETKEYILLGARLSNMGNDDTQLGGVMKIPKTWIRKRVDLTKHIK